MESYLEGEILSNTIVTTKKMLFHQIQNLKHLNRENKNKN